MKSQTIDLFIPKHVRRSQIGRFLTAVKGLRAEATKLPPSRPRVREHDSEMPVHPLRGPEQVWKGGVVERYAKDAAEPCQCESCIDKRTQDIEPRLPYYAPAYVEVGHLPFEQAYKQSLRFPEQYQIVPTQWVGREPTDDAFKEEEHPRSDAGEFASKAGGGTTKLSPSRSLVAAKEDRSDLPEHIQALKLPPAWKDVHYHPDPESNLLAIGTDAAGRKQYVYSEKFAKEQSVIKFARVRELEKIFGDMHTKNETNRQSHIPVVRDVADVTKLLMETGIRPGSESDTKAKEQAYGATTLKGEHVHTDASGTSLKFVGKKGVKNNIPINDPDVAAMLSKRAEESGAEGQLFPHVDEKKLQGYVKQLTKGGAKPKDLRTLKANNTAASAMRDIPAPKNETEYKKSVHEVARRVSKVLGNTPTVALASYIHPDIFSHWRAGLSA